MKIVKNESATKKSIRHRHCIEGITKAKIATGVAHTVPADVRVTLMSNPRSLAVWNSLTPLSRNEWICWIISVKKSETRRHHIQRMCSELLEGKRRPCCWTGCVHR